MPKNGKSSYSQDQLKDAVDAVRKGMGVNAAARSFGVPKSTVMFRVKKPENVKITMGPCPIIGERESIIVEWIKECHRKGFPRRKNDVLDSVQDIVKKEKLQTPFKNDRPADGWYNAFLKRHPEISRRTPEAVSTASACVSESDIRGWFQNCEELLRQDNLIDILNDPNRVLNGDETNFLLCPQSKIVLAPKGSKNVYETDIGPAKAAITCMFSFTAAGEIIPPMLVYPFKRIPYEVIKDIPKNWGVGRSENGWMTSEVFYEYIGNVLFPWLMLKKTKFPVILFVDGHKSHLTLQVSQLCSELNIVLIALYPNATRILQPADVSAFKPLKTLWTEELRTWRNENLTETVSKSVVAPLLERVLTKLKKSTLQNGFKATGLYPWNPDAIDYTKCISSGNTSAPPKETNEVLHKQISYDRFSAIVGEDRINIFKAMENEGHTIPEEDPTSNDVLFKIYKELAPGNEGKETSKCNVVEDASTKMIRATTSSALKWPQSPKRKGKRQTEKLPFVLTSERWQNIVSDKAKKRKNEEEAKQQRKKLREEKKIDKLSCTKNKVSRQNAKK